MDLSLKIYFDEIIKQFDFIKNMDKPWIYKKVSGIGDIFLILYIDNILLIENDIYLL
jgi:hypothetical protein